MMIKRFVFAVAIMLASWQSSASFIEGQIDFTGSAILTLNNSGTAVSQIEVIEAEVELATGDYSNAGVMAGDTTTFADPLDLNSTPINALWSVGGFSFDLVNLLVNTVIELPLSYDIAAVQGNGVIHHDSFEDTLGSWTFTTQTNGNLQRFSFSSTVPEPSAMLLLSLGLFGLMMIRRRAR